MRTIFKYPLQVQDAQRVEMPRGARVLSVQWQSSGFSSGGLVAWALVETDQSVETRLVRIYGTGHQVATWLEPDDYVGTVQDPMGLVWHVFVEPAR